MLNAGQVLSREQLLDQVWGFDFDPGSNVVDVYVGYLRRKFGADTIATVRGMGYRFNALTRYAGPPSSLASRQPRHRGWRASTGSSASATSCGSGRSAGSPAPARRTDDLGDLGGTSRAAARGRRPAGVALGGVRASGSPSSNGR